MKSEGEQHAVSEGARCGEGFFEEAEAGSAGRLGCFGFGEMGGGDVGFGDEVRRGLGLERGEDEDEPGKHEVQAGEHLPLCCRVAVHVDLAAAVADVRQHDAKVDEAGEETGTEAADVCRSGIGVVNKSLLPESGLYQGWKQTCLRR